jgi:hypothetical protein
MAVAKAHKEFTQFRVKQDLAFTSDFDQTLAKYLKGEDKA